MLQVFQNANFPMMGRTKVYFIAFSILACVLAGSAIALNGFNFGIDFAGGTAVQVKFRERPPIDAVRVALEQAGLGDITIQRIGEEADHEVLIRVEQAKGAAAGAADEGGSVSAKVLAGLRTPEEAAALRAGKIDLNMAPETEMRDWLAANLPGASGADGRAPSDATAIARAIVAYRTQHDGFIGDLAAIAAIPGVTAEAARPLQEKAILGGFSLRSVDFVGPTAGRELLINTALAILFSITGILIYVWFRFHKWLWGLTAVIALAHDVLIAAGAMALTRKEFSLPVVAALLTILGYSINDTIVVFDRIRENLRLYRDIGFETIVNASVNQTLSRTVLTSFTVFIAVTALFMYGGEKLNPMSFCLMVGVVFGTYSSVFVAAGLLVMAHNRYGARAVKG